MSRYESVLLQQPDSYVATLYNDITGQGYDSLAYLAPESRTADKSKGHSQAVGQHLINIALQRNKRLSSTKKFIVQLCVLPVLCWQNCHYKTVMYQVWDWLWKIDLLSFHVSGIHTVDCITPVSHRFIENSLQYI